MNPGDRLQIIWTSLQTHEAVVTAAKLAEMLELPVDELALTRLQATPTIAIEDALSWIEGTRTAQDIVRSEITVAPVPDHAPAVRPLVTLGELLNGLLAELLARHDYKGFTIEEVGDVKAVLRDAQGLLNRPGNEHLQGRELTRICVFDTSDDDNGDLMVTVDPPAGPRLATGLVGLRFFQQTNDTPGEPVVRLVLTELLGRHHSLLARLARARATTQTQVRP